MRRKLVLPLPRIVLHPITAPTIAAVHVYLASAHLAALEAGQVVWTHIWKGFGALLGAYVFAALASRRIPTRVKLALPGAGGGVKNSERVPILRRLRRQTPGQSDYRTNPVLGLHISGNRTNRPKGLQFNSQFLEDLKSEKNMKPGHHNLREG